MHSEPEERLSINEKRRIPRWVFYAAAATLIIAVYLFSTGDTPPPIQAPLPPSVSAKPPPAAVVLPPAPDIPVPEPARPTTEGEITEEVALTLEISDQALRTDLTGAGNSRIFKAALASEDLIERGASVVDGFSRGRTPYKALPIKPPVQKFTVVTVENQLFIDPASYQRYDVYATTIAELDTATLVITFNRFRPLMEQAYAALGYRAEDFDNAVTRSLDRILATPELHEPIPVKRKEAIYLHADPRLEALTDVQKLLLRMGPDNVVQIKTQAQALRNGLLGSASP